MPDQQDPYGFDSTRRMSTEDRIRKIQPEVPPVAPIPLERVDAIAEREGFVSREQMPVLQRRARQVAAPRFALNMRVPMDVADAFQQFCDEERYSYPEAFEEVMIRAGLWKKRALDGR